ncbi:MAG: AAA family ATPase [Actinomycetota bacterium]|nr:AAA family ATPase [Actinomycetota bacterium]
MTPPITNLVVQRDIVVCCGPGGVGKTTVAAALAVEGARRGRRTVVVTIDPAKRLADALGLDDLTDTPRRIDGAWPGELWALMLDPRSTFDGLVTRYAPNPGQAETILANRFYRNIAGALSGTQEYMAMEKLFELHNDERFDLVLVDTPPTRNALEFVDAPRRLTRLLDNRLFRLLMMPARTGFRAVNLATQAFLRTIGKVVGSEVVSDAVTFFQAFEGMEDGFRQRAQGVQDLLADPCTAFILVTSPRRDAARETEFFAEKLGEAGIDVEALIVNRMHPRFPAVEVVGDPALVPLYRNLSDLARLADGEEAHVAALAERVGAPAVRVPELETDVHDLPGLARVAAHVFG